MGLVGSSWKKKRLQGWTRICLQVLQLSKKSQQMDYLHLTFCVFNAYFSYTATLLNIVAIYAIRKTSSLSKNLKTMLLSQAVSDLGVGLLVQPMVVAQAMNSKQNSDTKHIASLIPTNLLIFATNLFIFATLFSVTALCADRFLAIRLNLSYQELVTDKRVAATVISIWVISAIISLITLFLPTQIMYVSFVIIESACIVTATSLSAKLYLTIRRHINQIQVLQVAPNDQGESVQRKRKSAMTSLYVYLVFIACYLPDICVLIILASTSEPTIDLQHLQFYTVTLLFLNSTLNPLIYFWRMKRIQHTIVGTLRHNFSSPT